VLLNTKCYADESSRTWLGAPTRKAGYLRLDRAVFEGRLLDDRKNLAATYPPAGPSPLTIRTALRPR
jgi:hypothetical protein